MIGNITRKIKRFIHPQTIRRSQVVVLVPSSRRKNDPVLAISSFLLARCKGLSECVFISNKRAHFVDALPVSKSPDKKHVVLFAHPAESCAGFEVNGPGLPPPDCITPEWWKRPDRKWEMLVAHVCKGKNVLDSSSWRDVFPNWVSYKVPIDALLSKDHDKKVWAEIGMAIVEAAIASRTAKNLANRIRSAYLAKMAELGDFGNPRDVIHVLHFENAMEGLVYHQEEEERWA